MEETNIKSKSNIFNNKEGYKDEDYVHYLYKITNKTNGKYYIGIHSFPKDRGLTPENDGYWGSGTLIRKAIKDEGRSNFEKEVLKTFSTRQELSDAEKQFVTIEEVINPLCYNSTLGGDDNFLGNIGWVICRPKSAIDKIIKISREEYYKNKHLYIPIGHIKFYLETKDSEDLIAERKKKSTYKVKQKLNESDTLFNRRRDFVNKITLEIKTFIGHDEPENLFDIWFPTWFLDKANNRFITYEYFKELYDKNSNLVELSKIVKVSRSNLMKVRDFYISKGFDLPIYKNQGEKGGFSDKCNVSKDGKFVVIDKSELEKYLSMGYEQGKILTKVSTSEILESYISMKYSLKELNKLYHIPVSIIKSRLGLKDSDPNVWFNNGSITVVRKVNESIKSKILSNGWVIGKAINKK